LVKTFSTGHGLGGWQEEEEKDCEKEEEGGGEKGN
jgi:hypothetical protein